ncbi:MAG: peptidase S1 [Alphaproteobacteria bacterium]
MLRKLCVAALASLCFSTAASAQDIGAEPTYRELHLDTNFQPDPQRVDLDAGGGIDAITLGGGCAGMIANAPDVDLYFDSGRYPLNIYVRSNADTTLVVNLPNGEWICSDDAEGFNPLVTLRSPPSGLYNIWVGTYVSGPLESATLYVSEIEPEW